MSPAPPPSPPRLNRKRTAITATSSKIMGSDSLPPGIPPPVWVNRLMAGRRTRPMTAEGTPPPSSRRGASARSRSPGAVVGRRRRRTRSLFVAGIGEQRPARSLAQRRREQYLRQLARTPENAWRRCCSLPVIEVSIRSVAQIGLVGEKRCRSARHAGVHAPAVENPLAYHYTPTAKRTKPMHSPCEACRPFLGVWHQSALCGNVCDR